MQGTRFLAGIALSVAVVGTSGRVSAEPASRTRVIPAGTPVSITLDSPAASDRNRVVDRIRAHTRRAIVVDRTTVIPAGSLLTGHITRVVRPGRVKGRGQIAYRFDRLTPAGSHAAIPFATTSVARIAPATKAEDAEKIVVPAIGGAAIGAAADGGKGAAIGGAVGGGAGTAVVLSTRGPDVHVAVGATATVRLLKPVTVTPDMRR